MKTGKIGLALSEDILKVSDHNTKTATTTEPKLVPSSDKKGGLYYQQPMQNFVKSL